MNWIESLSKNLSFFVFPKYKDLLIYPQIILYQYFLNFFLNLELILINFQMISPVFFILTDFQTLKFTPCQKCSLFYFNLQIKFLYFSHYKALKRFFRIYQYLNFLRSNFDFILQILRVDYLFYQYILYIPSFFQKNHSIKLIVEKIQIY